MLGFTVATQLTYTKRNLVKLNLASCFLTYLLDIIKLITQV